jgi:hypothetical protein
MPEAQAGLVLVHDQDVIGAFASDQDLGVLALAIGRLTSLSWKERPSKH